MLFGSVQCMGKMPRWVFDGVGVKRGKCVALGKIAVKLEQSLTDY